MACTLVNKAFAIRKKCIYFRNGVGVQIPRAIEKQLNLAPELIEFEVSIVDGGLFLRVISKEGGQLA